jgi:hypothetical protein
MKNNKKELLKLTNSLKSLLASIKEEEKSMIESIKFASDGMSVPPYDIDGIHGGINNLEKLLSIPNESIEFLKKLIKIEKNFKNFPEFRSFIPAREIIYADIENNMDEMASKTDELRDRNHIIAYTKSAQMISDLKTLNNIFFLEVNNDYTRMRYHEYKSKALDIVNEARPELEMHRGFKQILVNLLIIITSLGAAPLINKAITGKFLFYKKTDSSEKLDNLVNAIDDKHLYFPGVVNRTE